MLTFLKSFKERFADIIGLNQLHEDFSVVFYIHMFFLIYTTVEKVFINTLLFTIFGDMTYVIIYRGIGFVITALSMQLSAFLLQKIPTKTVVNISIGIYLLMYGFLFFGLNDLSKMWYIVAIFSGIGNAFYWSAHSVLLLNYSNNKNRGIAQSATGVIEGIVTLFIPLIAGTIIGQTAGTLGYRIIFGIGMISALVQVYYSNKLNLVGETKKKSQLVLAIEIIRRDKDYVYMIIYEFIRGMRDGVFAFIMNMLLFQIITNETLTGVNTFLSGIMAIMGSWAYGKLVLDAQNKRKYFSTAVTGITIFALMLFWRMTPITLMIFTALNGFLQIFLTTSNTNTTYYLLSKHYLARRAANEIFALRELFITVGRVLGLVLLFVVPQKQIGYVIAIIILTVVQYIGLYFMKKVDKGVRA